MQQISNNIKKIVNQTKPFAKEFYEWDSESLRLVEQLNRIKDIYRGYAPNLFYGKRFGRGHYNTISLHEGAWVVFFIQSSSGVDQYGNIEYKTLFDISVNLKRIRINDMDIEFWNFNPKYRKHIANAIIDIVNLIEQHHQKQEYRNAVSNTLNVINNLKLITEK